MSTPVKGVGGYIVFDSKTLAQIRNWSLTKSAAITDWGSSSSGGYTIRTKGREDATGNAEFVVDSDSEIYDDMDVGSEGTISLYLNASLYFTGRVMITQLTFDDDLNDQTEVTGTFEFGQSWASSGDDMKNPGEA